MLFIHANKVVSLETNTALDIDEWINADAIEGIRRDKDGAALALVKGEDSYCYAIDEFYSLSLDEVLKKVEPERQHPEGWTEFGYTNF